MMRDGVPDLKQTVSSQLEALVLAQLEGDDGGKTGKKRKQQRQSEDASGVVGACLELYARLLEVSDRPTDLIRVNKSFIHLHPLMHPPLDPPTHTQLQVTCDYWSGGNATSTTASSSSSTSRLLQRLLPSQQQRSKAVVTACKPALDHLAVARLRQLRQETGVRGVVTADSEEEEVSSAWDEMRPPSSKGG